MDKCKSCTKIYNINYEINSLHKTVSSDSQYNDWKDARMEGYRREIHHLEDFHPCTCHVEVKE